ncbi:hypothetical protein ACF9IK_00015 [Kitasatospora hibisci]|uniref:hypothetical protein n=1 Tax=Kitasatospora hibisci TaxID=3369522 RepID=UPI0037546645
MYDNPRVALKELTDSRVFERVAWRVLQRRFPDLVLTSATGDTGMDAYSRPMFSQAEEVVVWASFEAKRAKLDLELKKHQKAGRQANAIFATNKSSPTEATAKNWRRRAKSEFGVDLEVLTLDYFVGELETDALRWVGELELGVSPVAPRRLLTWGEYQDRMAALVPGMTAPLVGREAEVEALRMALADETATSRVVVVEGPGGVGKTRLSIESAKSVATTLVAPPGVDLTAEAFESVPLDAPLIVIVDDAHRSPGLSGLPTLLHDSRFDRLRLVLTVRPNARDRTLYRWGLERWAGPVVELQALDREPIDLIVTDRGIHNPAFRRSVVDLAEGNPLIAHTACDVGLATGTFTWGDASSLLREMIKQRLPHDEGEDALRAAAVALALLGTARDGGGGVGEDLGRLHGAVARLPRDADRLAGLLSDLADAGLADGPPYTLRPDLVGPVLLADALDPSARVRLDVREALHQLSVRAGVDQLATGPAVRSGQVEAGAAQLGSQLASLAVAARDRADDTVGGQLHDFVVGLLASDADLGEWAAVVGLAREVAPAAPGLLGDLHVRLMRQWLPAASPRWWGGSADVHRRNELVRLGQSFAGLASVTGLDTSPSPVTVLLDLAWLMEPYVLVGADRQGDVLGPIGRWCTVHAQALPAGYDALLARRRQILRALAQWGSDRTAAAPLGLAPGEAANHGPASIARVLLAAVQPLLRVTFESMSAETPQDAATLTLRAHVLPDSPETTAQLRDGLALLAPFLTEPQLRLPENLPVLHALVGLPGQLRGEGARPVLGDAPVPAYAVAALEEAVGGFGERIAGCWADLPLPVRRSAAQASLGPAPRPTTLVAAADAGDPVAAAALSDAQLAPLLVLQPLDGDLPGQAALRSQHNAAVELARRSSAPDAFALLEEVGPGAHGTASAALPAFAHAFGAAATDPEPVLERLAAGPVTAGDHVLAGLAEAHPDAAWAWIKNHAANTRLATLALQAVDQYPHGAELEFLEATTASLTTDPPPDDAAAVELAHALIWHLFACQQPLDVRLRLLAQVGHRGAAAVVPRVLTDIGHLVGDLGSQERPDAATLQQCADVLRRSLELADSVNGFGHGDGAGYGAAQFARAAPREFAAILTERLLDGRLQVIPASWEDSIARLPSPVREQLAEAFHDRMEEVRAEGPVAERIEAAAGEMLTCLGQGTGLWADLLGRWAHGNESERRRAAAAVTRAWQDPAWAGIVSDVLAAGVDAASRQALLLGITQMFEPVRDLPGAATGRREALAPLLWNTNSTVQAFAGEALRALDAMEEADARAEAAYRRGYR